MSEATSEDENKNAREKYICDILTMEEFMVPEINQAFFQRFYILSCEMTDDELNFHLNHIELLFTNCNGKVNFAKFYNYTFFKYMLVYHGDWPSNDKMLQILLKHIDIQCWLDYKEPNCIGGILHLIADSHSSVNFRDKYLLFFMQHGANSLNEKNNLGSTIFPAVCFYGSSLVPNLLKMGHDPNETVRNRNNYSCFPQFQYSKQSMDFYEFHQKMIFRPCHERYPTNPNILCKFLNYFKFCKKDEDLKSARINIKNLIQYGINLEFKYPKVHYFNHDDQNGLSLKYNLHSFLYSTSSRNLLFYSRNNKPKGYNKLGLDEINNLDENQLKKDKKTEIIIIDFENQLNLIDFIFYHGWSEIFESILLEFKQEYLNLGHNLDMMNLDSDSESIKMKKKYAKIYQHF